MDDLRGESGRWCPDCGTVLVAGQAICPQCGLDYWSPNARDTERANAELHRLGAQIDQLTDQRRSWLEYRSDVLGLAVRNRADASKTAADAAVVWPAVEPSAPLSAAPGATKPLPEGLPPTTPPPPPPPPPSATPQAETSPRQLPASLTEAAVAMRPAKRLTAPVLLGVAGAALFILAGIVFVAASWSDYPPASRMAVLIVFAGLFAWLARMATRHEFSAVGGALGVVSATFVGVGAYALTTGPAGPVPYTAAMAVLIASAMGLGLARLGIKAVGEASAVGVIVAAEAGAIEGAFRSSGATLGMATYAIVAALVGAAMLVARALWGSATQRAIVTYGGMGVVFAGAFVAVLSPLSAHGVDGAALAAIGTSAAASAVIAAWRPAWGGGVLTATASIGAVTAAAMWDLSVGMLVLVFSVGAFLVALGLGRLPAPWRIPGLWGLAPGLVFVVTSLVLPVIDSVPRALTGSGLDRDWSSASVGGMSWYGGALLLLAAMVWVTSRWDTPTLFAAGGARMVAALAFAAGTVFLALDGAVVAAHGASAAGLGLSLAAVAQWFAADVWGAARRGQVRAIAVAVAAFGGLHGTAVVASVGSNAELAWGTLALLAGLFALAGAAIVLPYAAAWGTLVAIVGVSAWTWQASGSSASVAVASTVAALGIAAVATRLPTVYVPKMLLGSVPAYAVAGLGVATGALVSAIASGSVHSAGLSLDDSWALWLSGLVMVGGPVIAVLAGRVGVAEQSRFTRAITGAGALALVLLVVARSQQTLADAGGTAGAIADAGAPALAVAVGAAAYGIVALSPPWRPARVFVGIGAVAFASLHGIIGLGRLAFDSTDLWWAVGALALAAVAMGVTARWVPRATLASGVGLASLIAPAALAPQHGELALAVASITAAGIAWAAPRARSVVRANVLLGGGGVLSVASLAGLAAVGVSVSELVQTWAGDAVDWRPWWLVTVAAVTAGTLAWAPVRRAAGVVVAAGLAVAAGLMPSPVGWAGLAVIGLLSTEAAARWGGGLRLHRAVPLALLFASLAWSAGHDWSAAIALAAMSLAALWTAIRGAAGATRMLALVLAPVAGAVAVFLALVSWNVDQGPAAVIAVGTALTMPLVAVATGLDRGGVVAVWILGVTSVTGPLLTQHLGLAGLAVVLACAAWFTLSTLGAPWARWLAFGGLSVAAILLAADVGIATLEAYTAVPALTMIVVGLWWLGRNPQLRTYYALAPGLGVALVPSYLALAIHPGVAVRTLALVGAALVLAVVGVARRWFAPLVATAVTTIVVAVSQATGGDSLLPVWLSVSIIGAVLFALAILAERIRAMR